MQRFQDRIHYGKDWVHRFDAKKEYSMYMHGTGIIGSGSTEDRSQNKIDVSMKVL